MGPDTCQVAFCSHRDLLCLHSHVDSLKPDELQRAAMAERDSPVRKALQCQVDEVFDGAATCVTEGSTPPEHSCQLQVARR